MTKDITVVLPVYNAEDHINETIDSVFNQTYNGSIELLIINDGSEDNSMKIIWDYLKNNSRDNIEVKVYDDGENLGPGYRRNFGIKSATGKAIQFLDSDDFLMPNALEKGFDKLFEDKRNSFVLYEWAYYYDESMTTGYISAEPFDKFKALSGRGCEMLLRSSTFYTVHKLYRLDFLIDNEIYYGEDYIYEDLEFYVKTAIRAQRVPMIPNILYKIRVHSNSITKTNADSMKHYNSFLTAIRVTYDLMINGYRNNETPYHVSKYFLRRAIMYSDRRLPRIKNVKHRFLKETLKIINEYNPKLEIPRTLSPYYNQIFNSNIIKEKNVKKLLKIEKEHKSGKINYYNYRQKRKNVKKQERKLFFSKIKTRIEKNYYLNPLVYNSRRLVHKRRSNKKRALQLKVKNSEIKNQIIMLGFDYKYTGNSRYLFEFLKVMYSGEQLKFVTFDMRVPSEYRISPRTKEFFEEFYSSKIIIAESWIPHSFEKKEGQKWIQLWHGTPLKKMLFDTHESSLLRLNPKHRVNKKKDIERWDFLLSDSLAGSEKLRSAFDIQQDRIINYGYPRNEFLVKNKNNEELKKSIKLMYHIPQEKKIILYVPTWRDYNYKQAGSNLDYSYQLDIRFLSKQLGDDYLIINKGHSMDKRDSRFNNLNIVDGTESMETQELLLISDIIITDYSSIFYDGIHIGKPFYILAKDKAKFEKSRGAYDDFMKDIESVTFNSDIKVAKAIINKKYDDLQLKSKYFNDNIKDSSESIYKLIEQLLNDDGNIENFKK